MSGFGHKIEEIVAACSRIVGFLYTSGLAFSGELHKKGH